MRRYCRYCPYSAVCLIENTDPPSIWVRRGKQGKIYCGVNRLGFTVPSAVIDANLVGPGWSLELLIHGDRWDRLVRKLIE